MADTPQMPAPVAHRHSNGDFCQDRPIYPTARDWPVELYTAAQMYAFRAEGVREALERAANACDKLSARAVASQSGPTDDLSNVMLRQVAYLGHSECAKVIRALRAEIQPPQKAGANLPT